MMPIKPNLSEQQVCFCDEYLVSFNAYRAAISAGYSENTARKGELLHTPKIQEYLRLKMQQRGERLEITHDMILREYAKIAFSSMGNYYDESGTLKPMCELTETEKAAISQYQIMDALDGDGNRVGELCKIKLHNKMSALDKIARHLGFFEAKQEARNLKQEAVFEGTVEEVAVEEKIVEETAAAVGLGDECSVVETTDFDLKGIVERDENILTLSPLLMIDGLSFDGLNDNYIARPPVHA